MRPRLPAFVMVVLALLLAAPSYAAPPDSDHRILVMLRAAPSHYRPDQSYGGSYSDELGASARMRIARRVAARHRLTVIENWPMPILGIDCFVMRTSPERSAGAVAVDVTTDKDVAWSQPIRLYQTQGAPPAYNDPLFAAQPAAKAWRLAELHAVATGRGVAVAVIDSGVDTQQPDLRGQISIDRDFTGHVPLRAEWHGTGVAGIIAARGGNGAGIVGIAPASRLLALRACWETGATTHAPTVCDSFSLAKALDFALNRGAPIINMSLSGPPDLLLQRLIEAGLARGRAIVAAVDPAAADGGFPASMTGVIAVSDRPVRGGRNPVYVAPGRDIPTTEPGSSWSIVNGSSYSAAHVSGLLALLREGQPADRPIELATAGGGLVNACLSLTRDHDARECLCNSAC
ncbi:S8 family peptidase [Sphingomonas nostoxanthinifaciens]|uniref:S8 family peptidase n=1 Tax=Sphingomonas nostoxanthinifaciens TaxID=2872652 RepID=UPI001CC219AD|nr:S8 family serine peptidase [Sphingomonas nostoxanthinifaciens]UAK23194.1 S8 family serine peptidase [Sphingomonas nostoxanthinifaciens]